MADQLATPRSRPASGRPLVLPWQPAEVRTFVVQAGAVLGLTAAGLARRLGCSPAVLGSWRAGRKAPSGLYAFRLVALLAEAGLLRAMPDARQAPCSIEDGAEPGAKP